MKTILILCLTTFTLAAAESRLPHRIWNAKNEIVQTVPARLVPLITLPAGYVALPLGQRPTNSVPVVPAPVKTDQERAAEISAKLAEIAAKETQ